LNAYYQRTVSEFLKKHFFLVAALLALATGFYFTLRETRTDETYLGLVQKGLWEEIKETRRHMDQLLASVPDPDETIFSDFSQESLYPYFLYKDSTLIWWSDHRYALDFSALPNGQPYPQVLSTPQGKFVLLVRTREVTDTQYVLVALLRLYSTVKYAGNDHYQGYNPRIFPASPNALSLSPSATAEMVRDQEGKELFYVEPSGEYLYNSHAVPVQTVLLIALAIVLAGVYVFLLLRRPPVSQRHGIAFVVLVAYLLLARGLMLRFAIPFSLTKSRLFDPHNYRVSPLSPSLGDLLLNCLCLVIVLAYFNSTYYRTSTYRQLIGSERPFKLLLSFLLLLVSYVAFYTCYSEFRSIYEQPFFSLDITQSIAFDTPRIAAILVFVCISCCYFLITHLLMNVYIRLNPRLAAGLGLLAASLLVAVLVGGLLRIPFAWVFLVHVVYILILYFTNLPRSFYGFRYPTTVYYLVGALACALLATYVVDTHEQRRDTLTKKEFARQVLSNNDPFAELLLKETNELIARDTLIRRLFADDTPLAREIIQQRIRGLLSDDYLGQYDLEVSSFTSQGTSLVGDASATPYDSLLARYDQPAHATQHPDLFLVSEPDEGTGREYVSFVPLYEDSERVGAVVLNLRLGSQARPVRHSELVLDEKLALAPGTSDFSYAIFENGKQVSSYGPYNYGQKLPPAVLQDSSLYTQGLNAAGFRHVGVRAANNRLVVVSLPSWGWKGTLANFSFQYLILVIVVSLTIIYHAVHYRMSSQRLTYATKIQVMLNAAFILPLLIVLFFILKIIENHYRENQREAQLENTRNISLNVVGSLSDFQQGKMSRAYLERQIQQVASDSDLDINLYDTTGRLFLSSKPLLYETGLLSRLINPAARRQIVEQNENQLLLEESLGNRLYSTTYVGLKTPDQRLLGVVSIPFFDARPSLDRQIIDIVASVLIVFTAMLLVFLLVSYLAANLLIDPLRVLTRKIGTTTLDQPNEPLPWQSNDEIGTLIKKYNQMLVNLESKKQAITTNEKQSAWREMARQVAHEIKNPLTPMKLTLQQLQRTIRRDDPHALEKVGKAMESMIEQIDNIGYIAQSFSDIARMPPPQIELFEITALTESTFDAYTDEQPENEKTIFHKEIQPGPLYVNGDRQQFATSIKNLIQNARQSIPEGRAGEVWLRLYAHNENILIEIQDNGSGIPQSIRSRVFLPNFSTREGGTGLNLAMAKRIIEYAGGSIWFETEEGKGTTFYFSVPLAQS
jgi:two-component system, NtrC family, nitrogen regulation sensor histidine kinase NtrY